MVEGDSYVETLDSMIELFQGLQNPGSITLENITRHLSNLWVSSPSQKN